MKVRICDTCTQYGSQGFLSQMKVRFAVTDGRIHDGRIMTCSTPQMDAFLKDFHLGGIDLLNH